MSSAIRELHLEAPPVVLERLGNRNVTVWRASCDCGYRTKTHPMIGLVMVEVRLHCDLHRLRWKEAS